MHSVESHDSRLTLYLQVSIPTHLAYVTFDVDGLPAGGLSGLPFPAEANDLSEIRISANHAEIEIDEIYCFEDA